MMAKQKPNLLDRAIAAISPSTAFKRLKSRAMYDMMAGGYFGGGGRRGRPALSGWNPGVGDANADISPDLEDLRAYSRDLARTSALAGGAISTVVNHVVGTGLSLQPEPDHEFLGISEDEARAWVASTTREYKLWAESTECDITLQQNFYGLQSLAFRSVLESGDILALFPFRASGRPYRMAVQLVEADRLCNPGNQADGQRLIAGVEVDEFGAAQTYHVCNVHPGSRYRAGAKWSPVPARSSGGRRNAIHLFERRRPGQARGVPYLAAVIEPLKQLTRYSEAEISAAVVSAAFAVFVKMDADAFGSLFGDGEQSDYFKAASKWDGSIQTADLNAPGRAVNLLPGESVEAPALGRPNAQFDPFVMAVLRQVGVGLELPFEVLVKHFTSSYSAARAALLDAWRFFRIRRDWLVGNFCQPVYELWLEEAVALGRVRAPGFFADPAYRRAWCAAVWIGDGPGSIDPLKEVAAAEKRISIGISTVAAESILHDGVDWETKHRQRAREVEARRVAGLDVDPVAERIRTEPIEKEPAEETDDREGEEENDGEEDDDALPPPKSMRANRSGFQAQAGQEDAGLARAMDSLARVIESTRPAPVAPPVVNITNHLPEGPAPEVRVEVAAPSVTIEPAVVNLEATLPAPTVHVSAPSVSVAAPNVNVSNTPAPVEIREVRIVGMPTRETTSHVERDAKGDISRTTQREKDAT